MAFNEIQVSDKNHDALVECYELAKQYNMHIEGVSCCKVSIAIDKFALILFKKPKQSEQYVEHAIERAYSLYDIMLDLVVDTNQLKL